MRVLIIGGGGREHALAWKLTEDDPSLELIAAPGNPGIAELGECVPIPVTDLAALQRLAFDRAVDLTIVGPEGPLAAGIVDRFRAAGLRIFGPTRAAAEIETSKAFSKQLMREDGIPTARAEVHTRTADAKLTARRYGAPVVIKASGLASGKGVMVCATIGEADRAIDDMLEGNRFGDAGSQVLVEEFMEGEELSVFAVTDGQSFVLLPGLQDHKRLLDQDRGPNTGGMGAYTPVSLGRAASSAAADAFDSSVDVTLAEQVSIIGRTLAGLARRGRPFTGLLYAGLMITRDGAKVVEFNCRFGDPETEALLPVLDTTAGLAALLIAAATGSGIEGFPVASDSSVALESVSARVYAATLRAACVTTVLAAANYPDAPRLGDPIMLPAPEAHVHVFHAGTARDAQGQLVTAGGRVLAVSAVGATVEEARARSAAYARRVQFAGKQFRTDIGWREIARRAPVV
jgi:phosphoribosylamine--glycine ligase